MSVLTRISAALTDMTPGEQHIARFVLEEPEKVCQLTSSQIAKAIGISQSSVVKFSKKQGYIGFSQLKLAVNEAVVKRETSSPEGFHASIVAGDTFHEMSQKLIAGKLHCIRETMDLNKEDAIYKVLEAVDGARRIHLAGVGSSSLVARDFSVKLLKIGRVAFHDLDSHVQIANASAMSKDDLLIAISHSGTSRETIEIAKIAREKGASVVTMTRPADNPLNSLATFKLYTVADEDKARVSSITARDAQLLLIDLLFIQIAQLQPNSGEFIRNSRTAVEKLKNS